MKITFVDAKCPSPYDSEVLRTRGLGGTEATVIRIAQALSAGHDVTVIQHNRERPAIESPRLRFLPVDSLNEAVRDAQHVVLVQKTRLLRRIARQSSARLWVWLHNYLGDEVRFGWTEYLTHRVGIICVSRTHAQHTRDYIRRFPLNRALGGVMGRGGVLHQYNPLSEACVPPAQVERDPHKLISLSSPHKGLDQVVAAFRHVHAADPRMKLYVANPGYFNADPTLLEASGIVQLGSLPQAALLDHVKNALCVFYPQRKQAETFGLVYAEANAVGTPVLAHDFGAAREILVPNNPPLDLTHPARIIDTVRRWSSEGGPIVGADERFALANVAAQWEAFFATPDAFMAAQARAALRDLPPAAPRRANGR